MRLALNGWFWDSPATGSGQYTRRLVRALMALVPDLEITVVIPGESTADRLDEAQDASSSCVLHRIPSSRSNLAKVRFEQVGFPRACVRVGAGVAHVPFWGAPARSPMPLVVTIHDVIPVVIRHYRGGVLQRLYTALVSATARGADLVLTDSEASRRDIVRRLAIPQQRVRVIPLAVDESYHPQPETDDESTRAAYDLPERYILYLGGFDRRKNLATVLAAYRWAGPAIGERCPLVIAGRLPERDTCFTPDPRRLMREERVPEQHVQFIGFVQEADKPALYRGATAFFFPSRYEGFGLPPLEALACGTPVVGSDVASLPEIVGDAGCLLPANDARGMAGMLIRLVDDEGFRARMSQRAVAQAETFSWTRTAKATMRAYEAVLS